MTETIRAMIIAYLDSLNITPETEEWQIPDLIRKAGQSEVGNVSIHDGASKICLVFKDHPFVIKWNYGYDFEEALDEVKIYKAAVAANLAFFFPKTELFYEKNGVSFVLQEKIDCSVEDSGCNRELCKAIKRITKTPKDKIYRKIQTEFNRVDGGYHRHLNEEWAKMAIALYGKKACKSLCKFIIAHKINDLHTSNLGYKNNKPIILDFSGYHR